MNEIIFQKNIEPSTNYQRYNSKTINYRSINNNSGINSNIINHTLQPINQNKPLMNTGLTHNTQITGNSKEFYKSNYKNIKIKKGRILSSGSLVSSKQSKNDNKVLKNGSEISNIDINNDIEENDFKIGSEISSIDINQEKKILKNGIEISNLDINSDSFLTFSLNKDNYSFTNKVSFNPNNTTKINSTIEKINNLNDMDMDEQSSIYSEINREDYSNLNHITRFFNKLREKINKGENKAYNKYQFNENMKRRIQPIKSLNYSINNNNEKSSNKDISKHSINPPKETNNEINKKQTKEIKRSKIVQKIESNNNSNYNKSTNQIPNKILNQSSNKLLNNIIHPNPGLSSNRGPQTSSKNNAIQNKPIFTSNKSYQNPIPSLQYNSVFDSNKILAQKDKTSNNNNMNNSNIIKKSDINKKEDDSKSRQSGSKTSSSLFPFQKLDIIANKQNYNGFKYCYQMTQAGKESDGNLKENQDRALIIIGIGNIIGFNMFGVLDGHGPQGHFASQFCKDYFAKNITELTEIIKIVKKINTAEDLYNELKRNGFAFIAELFNLADSEIVAKRAFDYSLSGTTCNLVLQFNKHLVCFSVGDSRSIIVFDKGDNRNMGIIPLSTDHKPDLPGEIDRIILKGGEVDRLKDMFGNKIGPARVFQLGSEYPGLAMSRSLGDFQAKQVGVIPSPQIIEYDINFSSKYLVICSDGVWEYVSNEQVRNIGNLFYAKNDVVGYCNELVKYSTGLWELNELIRDDITVVSVFF